MKLSEYARRNSICYRTAYAHWQKGLLKGKQLPTGTIVVFEDEEEIRNSSTYCVYCRVSSHDQKEDLARQEKRLLDFCSAKGWEVSNVYSEIASGLNDDRPKFNKSLVGDSNIVVEHRDRLTRFGFNYINNLLNKQRRKIVVINDTENKNDIIQDFISIITSFCARIYGHRRSGRKTEKLIKELRLETDKKR